MPVTRIRLGGHPRRRDASDECCECNNNNPQVDTLLTQVTGVLYTIPSLALFVVLPLIIPTRILDEANVIVALLVGDVNGSGIVTSGDTNLFTNFHVVEGIWESGDRAVTLERRGILLAIPTLLNIFYLAPALAVVQNAVRPGQPVRAAEGLIGRVFREKRVLIHDAARPLCSPELVATLVCWGAFAGESAWRKHQARS